MFRNNSKTIYKCFVITVRLYIMYNCQVLSILDCSNRGSVWLKLDSVLSPFSSIPLYPCYKSVNKCGNKM